MAEIHQRPAAPLDRILLDLSFKLRDAKSIYATTQIFKDTISQFGYSQFVYARSPESEGKGIDEYINLGNLDPGWMEHYISKEMFKTDYLIDHCLHSTQPLLWSELEQMIKSERLEKTQADVHFASRDWGVSKGVTLPLPCFGRFRAGLSLVADREMSGSDHDDVFQASAETITAIAHIFHTSVEFGMVAQDFYGLTKREIEVLKWLSDGFKTKEIAYRLKTSVHTVEKQVKSARERLQAASSAQAVAKGVLLGIIG